MKILCGTFWGIVLAASSLVAQPHEKNIQDYATKLQNAGFKRLAIDKWKMYVEDSSLSSKAKDDVYLTIYRLYSELASSHKDPKEQEKLTQMGKEYYDKISDKSGSSIKLELIKSNLDILKKARDKIEDPSIAEESKPLIRENGVKAFNAIYDDLVKIAKEAEDWIAEYDYMDEAQQRGLKREATKFQGQQVNAYLQLGEACVAFAALLGANDSQVRSKLIPITDSYQNFIDQYFGSPPAIVGSIYLGEINLLLGNYATDGGTEVDGMEKGETLFNDAKNDLEQYINGRYRDWATGQMLDIYRKQIRVYEILDKPEKELQAINDLLEFKPPSSVSPRQNEGTFNLIMYYVQKKCELLEKKYKADPDKEVLTQLYEAASSGVSISTKYKSQWLNNFKMIMARLPDAEGIDMTVDTAMVKANGMLRNAYQAGETKESSEDETGEVKEMGEQEYNYYFQAHLLYKKAIELSAKEGKSKYEEIYPQASFRLSECLQKLGAYYPALAASLRPIGAFPSEKYSEEEYPEVYKFVSNCAVKAKFIASSRYSKFGRTRFDKELYFRTLQIMTRMFPEEAGDSNYWMGILEKSSEEYSEAAQYFSKVDESSDLYGMAQFQMADSKYRELRTKEKLKGEDLDATSSEYRDPRLELIRDFRKIAEDNKEKPQQGEEMSDKNYKILLKRRDRAFSTSLKRVAELYRQMEMYAEARDAYKEILEQIQDDIGDRFNALKMLIDVNYKTNEIEEFISSVNLLEQLPPDGIDFTETEKQERLARYAKMLGAMYQKQINELKKEALELRKAGDDDKAVAIETRVPELYLKTADAFAKYLDISGEKDVNILTAVMMYNYNYSGGDFARALPYFQTYFEWYPEKPTVDEWYKEMLGKDEEAWDAKIGPYLHNVENNSMKIQHPEIKKIYSRFLDSLFDKRDYSELPIREITELRVETGDVPRNYGAALLRYKELVEKQDMDLNLKKNILPDMQEKIEKIEEASNYYNIRYLMAQCYSQLERHEEAADIYRELAQYFVELYQMRIELAKAEFLKGTEDSYDKARQTFGELLGVVPTPRDNYYNPKEFYSLLFWYMRTLLVQLGEDPAPKDVLDKIWRNYRSYILMDPLFFRKDRDRYLKIGLDMQEWTTADLLVDRTRDFVKEKILPKVREAGESSMANETWESFLNIQEGEGE